MSTATLYRWWDTKEAIMLDACSEHVMPGSGSDYLMPALAVEEGSPTARLREFVVRSAAWLNSDGGRIMGRLITGIHGDKKLQQLYLERFYLPRRQIQLRVIEEAIACRELKSDTDPELLVDVLHGPLFSRWSQGHAPVDKKFAEALADNVIPAFQPK